MGLTSILRYGLPYSEQGGQRSARAPGLRDEAAGAAERHERAEVGPVAARNENHGGTAAPVRQALRDVEAALIRQPELEQDEVGPELGCGAERGGAVLGLADDLETFGLEQRAGIRAEARVVVDDQYGHSPRMVADRRRSHHTVNRTFTRERPAFSGSRLCESLC